MQHWRRRSTRNGVARFFRTGRVAEDAASVWRRRRSGALVALLVFAVLVPITAAQAAPSIGVVPNFPTSPAVGETAPATFTVFNTSTSPDDAGTVTVTQMSLIPSCSVFAPGCAGGVTDPGTFDLSATGVGEAGTACAGRVFNITETNPANGEVTFTAADMAPVVLGPATLANDLDFCRINFTVTVLRAPNHDAIPAEPGQATAQLASASGQHLNGTIVTATNEDVTTIPAGPGQATPTITTVASPGVALGGQVTDTATLAGGTNPTGTITFNLYGPNDATCTGPPIFASQAPVAGNGAYTSGAYTPIAAGTYRWIASYSGDPGNAPAAGVCNAPNESVVVSSGPGQATPTVVTAASPSVALGGQVTDTATLAGGTNPTGTITFNLYGPNDSTCAGPAAFTDTVAVAGNGPYTSGAFVPTAAGTYRWIASYSGDAGNTAVTGVCNAPNESVVVTSGPAGATPTIATQVAPATALVGQNIVDTATLAGGNAPTGTITFNAYGPNDPTCSQAPVYSAVVSVNGNGAYAAAPPFVAAAPGQYRFIAAYSGDALNAAVSGACNDPNELHTATVAPLPAIAVDKSAAPTSLPAPGGDFTFSVAITNPSSVPLVITSITDSVYGNLGTRGGVNTCDELIGDTLPAAGAVSCSFQGTFTGAEGATETDVVTVVATDVAGNQATDQGSATVSLTAPAAPHVPGVQVEISPNRTSLEEPGGPVVYRVTITNTSNPVDITITSIVDTLYGNIAALPEPNTCDSVIGEVLSPGESVTCQFTVQFTGDAGTSRTHTITVTATAPDGTVVSDSAPAVTVTITDAEPEILVNKSVSPESRPAPGGQFTFTVTVANISGEPVVLTTLGDDQHGDLNGRGTCRTGVTIAANATYSCTYAASFTGEDGDRQVSTVIATVVDDEGNSTSEQDSVTVRLTDPVGAVATPTPSASPTPTASPSASPTASPTPSPSVSPSPTTSPPPGAAAGPKDPPARGIVRTGIDSLEWFALALALIALGSVTRRGAPAGRRVRRRFPSG